MSTRKFEIVSPKRLVEPKPFNWKMCFICQLGDQTLNIIAPYKKRGKFCLLYVHF